MILVNNIQRFSVHDGNGIRTVVFLQGCSLRCPWCANPETIACENRLIFDDSKCMGSDTSCLFSTSCNKAFAKSKINSIDLNHGDECPLRALDFAATPFSQSELVAECLKDKPFYRTSGGVTFSGGEPLLQMNKLEPVLSSLKADGVNIGFETSLQVKSENVERMLEYSDFVYADLKIVPPNDYEDVLGGSYDLFLKNLRLVDRSNQEYCIRVPLAHPFTFSEESEESLFSTLKGLSPFSIELFACHNLGLPKYRMLSKTPPDWGIVSDDKVEALCSDLKQRGYRAKAIKI